MDKRIIYMAVLLMQSPNIFSQSFPWERPLNMAWSSDGISFNFPAVYQDSSGVPSAVKWKGDTLVCAFQWFRAPMGSPTWDRVAVKFSYDNGLNWTQPVPIVVNGLPNGYQRPFDPALVVLNHDSLRIYFSSSDGLPQGFDSTVNTYSAVSADGINYTFEPGARVDEPNNRVIDPSVIHFHNTFHYLAPIGSPMQGAYHYISPNGVTFSKVQDIPSDAQHNWTGNYLVNDTGELRFYGTGSNGIWFNSTPNGGVWNGYVNNNIPGGDPTVIRTGPNNYLMIYTGSPYTTSIAEAKIDYAFSIFPNPANDAFTIETPPAMKGERMYIYSTCGREMLSMEIQSPAMQIDCRKFTRGCYYIVIRGLAQPVSIVKP